MNHTLFLFITNSIIFASMRNSVIFQDLKFAVFLLATLISCNQNPVSQIVEQEQFQTWKVVGGDAGVTHYAHLDQINEEDV